MGDVRLRPIADVHSWLWVLTYVRDPLSLAIRLPALRDVFQDALVSFCRAERPLDPSILILLAEDEHLIGLSLQTALEDGGYAVHHVYSGHDALAALERHDPKVSGVITDIKLGIGPDGWDVARRARELTASVPIIYMSGDSAHEHASKGVPDSAMLQKPFAPAQVVTAISTLLNEARAKPD